MHEMKWTELHIHGLFRSFDCVANAFYRSSLGWTKNGLFFLEWLLGMSYVIKGYSDG